MPTGGADSQRVSIGRRLGEQLDAQARIGARPVLDIKVLTNRFGQLFSHMPRGHVRALASLGDEAREAAQCGESTVARADRDLALLLTVLQKCSHFARSEVSQGEPAHDPLVPRGLSEHSYGFRPGRRARVACLLEPRSVDYFEAEFALVAFF